MGASLSAAAGQDTSSFTMRGLADTLPAMLTLLADVVRNPTFPQAEIDLLKANTTQSLQAQLASPQMVANRVYRQTLFGPHPYARVGATLDTVRHIDRASIVEYHKTLLPAEQRVSDRHRRRDARTRCSPRRRRRSAAGRAARCRRRRAPPTPSLQGRKIVFVQRPNSVQSSISVGNFTHPPQRSALAGAERRQPDLRRGVRFAAGAQHPRREGLHLLAAVGLPGDGAGRPLPRGGRRAQRRHRRDDQGDLQRDRQVPRRGSGARRNWRAPRPTRAASS